MKSRSLLSAIIGLFLLSACAGGKDISTIDGSIASGETSKDAPESITPGDDASSSGDEVIVPTGTPSDPSSDLPQEIPPSDGETPPPPPASATIASFDVSKVPTGRMNTVKIDWSFSNAKAAYLWGDFNREENDTSCGLVDGRHLVTAPDGNQLNEGSALYQQNLPYLEGILCDNANDATDDDCNSPSVSVSLRDGLPRLASRFSDLSARRDLYFYDMSKLENMHAIDVVKEEAPGSMVAHPIDPSIFGEPNPRCRIDLAKDASLIPSGSVTTRSLVQHGRFCLAVQGADDGWTIQCKGIEAPEVTLGAGSESVKISAQKPVVVLNFNYANAASAPSVEGCDETDTSTEPDANGSGHYQAECPIKKDAMKIRVSVKGLGKWNTDYHTYLASFGTPQATMKTYDPPPAANTKGEFQLHFEADRSCTVTDVMKHEVMGDPDARCPWVKGIRFLGQYVMDDLKIVDPPFRNVKAPSEAKGPVTVYRDWSHSSWSFLAFDFEGSPHESNVVDEFALQSGLSLSSDAQVCAKKLGWKAENKSARDAAHEAWVACGIHNLPCYKNYVEWHYGGDHSVSLALEATNLKSLHIECQGVSYNIGTDKDSIYSQSLTDIQGVQTKSVSVSGYYPVIECQINAQTVEGVDVPEIRTKDSCLEGYDYGSMDDMTGDDLQALFDRSDHWL